MEFRGLKRGFSRPLRPVRGRRRRLRRAGGCGGRARAARARAGGVAYDVHVKLRAFRGRR